MALSAGEISLCNLALMRAGSSKIIVTDGESTNEYRVANTIYSAARDFVLSSAPWEFATLRASLSGSATGPSNWAYQYDWPTLGLRILRVLPAVSTTPRKDEALAFQVFSSGTAMKVATNEASATAEYIKQITDTALFDLNPVFKNALISYLAAEMAVPLQGTPEVAKANLDAFFSIIKQESERPRQQFPETSISLNDGTTTTHLVICNMALARLGYKGTVSSLSDATDAARLCSLFFGEAVSVVLRAFPWPFATARKALVLNNSAIVDNWTFAYSLPTDLACVQSLVSPYGNLVREDQKIPYEIGFYSPGGVEVLYTNLEDATLIYTTTAVDSNNFDAMFREMLSWKLASDIGPGLGADPRISMACASNFQLMLMSAGARALNEEFEGPAPDNDYMTSRN